MPQEAHYSEFAWIQYLQQGLEPTVRLAMREHLECCGSCKSLVEDMAREREQFLQAHPVFVPGGVAPAGRSWNLRWAWAGAAIVLLVLLAVGLGLMGGGSAGEYRIKGSGVTWVVERAGEQFAWTGQPLREGDRLGMVIASPKAGRLKVLSLSESGESEELVAQEGSMEVQAGVRLLLPLSVTVRAPLRPSRLVILLLEPDSADGVDLGLYAKELWKAGELPPQAIPGLLGIWISGTIELAPEK